VYLLLPRDPLLHALVGRTVVAGVGDLAFGLAAIAALGPDGWRGQLAMVLAVVAAAVTYAAFGVLVHSLAFWIGDASGVASFLHDSMLALSMYPQSIYPERVKLLFFTALPVGFFAFVPVAIARDPDPGLVALALAFAVLFALLARAVFRTGLARYQSGSLLAGRS
jgi:ABC-2 type transport system permease protein